MAKTDFQSVDDYIAQQPQAVRSLLELVRGAIRKAVPHAEEQISYKMPAYKLRGVPVIYFAGEASLLALPCNRLCRSGA